MSNYVIIGAGQTGRGYINRILYLNNKNVTFLDKDEKLVSNLRSGSYKIEFGGSDRGALEVNNFDVYTMDSNEGHHALKEADFIFTSVGADNLSDVANQLSKVLNNKDKTVRLMTCENGIGVSKHFENLSYNAPLEVTEGIVFCTTLNNGTDILSEDLDWIPFDNTRWTESLPLIGFSEEPNLNILMERKIFTYNCLSAVVAYVGYLFDYEDYALAGNDPVISEFMEKIRSVLDISISKEYEIDLIDQKEFSNKAVAKFQNKAIKDTIQRNTRDTKRKLSQKERIMSPLLLINNNNLCSEELLTVCAVACYYGMTEEDLSFEEVTSIIKVLPANWVELVLEKLDDINSNKNRFVDLLKS